MKLLVSGISGLGGHLAPTLIARGHEVVGMSRDPGRVAVDVPCVRTDAATGEGLDEAMAGADAAYFLINTYEAQNLEGFAARDRRVAINFAAAARRAGVDRIIYLDVPRPADPSRTSPHLRSRLEVEDILLEQVPTSTSIGAFTIVSPRSRSFRVMMEMLRRNRVMPLPPWRNHLTEPIDIRDVFDALAVAAEDRRTAGQRLGIGGPEAMTWEQLLRQLVEAMHTRTRFVPVPFTPPAAAVRIIAARYGGRPALMLPLLESLAELGDVVAGPQGLRNLGITPRSVTEAVSHAVDEFVTGDWHHTEGDPVESVRPVGPAVAPRPGPSRG